MAERAVDSIYMVVDAYLAIKTRPRLCTKKKENNCVPFNAIFAFRWNSPVHFVMLFWWSFVFHVIYINIYILCGCSCQHNWAIKWGIYAKIFPWLIWKKVLLMTPPLLPQQFSFQFLRTRNISASYSRSPSLFFFHLFSLQAFTSLVTRLAQFICDSMWFHL